MHIQKIKNILLLNNEDRYWYSIREIAKLGKVWAISTPDSWVNFVDKQGDEIFPIWPHKEVAEICIFEELRIKDYSIESIEFDKFIKYCIPDMEDSNILFGVFYNENKEAIVVDAKKLESDLMEEN